MIYLNSISDYLQAVALYGLVCVVLSFFILGLFLSANHKFFENGVEKGLVLVGFKDWLDSLYVKMDSVKLVRALKNWVVLLVGVVTPVYAVVKFLQLDDHNYLALLMAGATLVFYQKSFEDIGVMVLGCYRCMSTFWVAIPMSIAGLYFGATLNSVYLWLLPGAVFTTGVISSFVSYIYMTYDECKLTVEDLKREREIYRTKLEICEQEKD